MNAIEALKKERLNILERSFKRNDYHTKPVIHEPI